MRFLFKIISSILLFIPLTACQNEIKKAPFKISMEVKVKENDSFQLFYTTSENEKFSTQHYTRIKVLGEKEFQTISFQFTTGKYPKNIRIDVGENQFETPIELNSIELIFKKDTIQIDQAVFSWFFSENQYLQKIDKHIFLRKKINDAYDPFFIATPLLLKKMELVF